MAFHGGDVSSGHCEVSVVCNHVAPRRPSHPFLFCFVRPISADDAGVGDPFVSDFSGVGDEVGGVGACNVGANTLGKSTDFVGGGRVPFRAFAVV